MDEGFFRELGRRVRRARERLPMVPTQAQAAELVGHRRNWWMDLEAGRLDPQISDLKRVAELVRLPLFQLLVPVGILAVEDEEAKRRDFLAGMAGLALVGIDRERLGAALAGAARLDDRAVEHLEQVAQALNALPLNAGPQAYLPAVLGHLSGIRESLTWVPPHLSNRVQALAGETAMVAGYLAFLLDRLPDADRYYAEAEGRAQMAGHVQLQAMVKFMGSWRWGDDEWGDKKKAVGLMNEAIALLGPRPDPAIAALAHSGRAIDLVESGGAGLDGHLALRDLEKAEDCLTRMVRPDAPAFLVSTVQGDVRHERGSALLKMGRPRDALAVLEALYTVAPEAELGWRAGILTHTAAAHAAMGEAEPACLALEHAWRLAREARNPYRARKVLTARESYLGSFETPAVRRLDEVLKAG